jgi:hypothetical protein
MKKILIVLAAILGLALLYVSYTYATSSAGSLPAYYPGFLAGSAIVHFKHAIAAFILAIACFIFAWFQGGPKKN